MGHGDGPGRAVTLHDVAREAGVAVSTVSRALTRPDRVGEATREHVRAVAERLGYRPNLLARALPSGRTGMLGLLVQDITNPHHFGLIRGAEARARESGYTLVLGDTQESPVLEAEHLQRLASVVDGFVLASSRLDEHELTGLLGLRPAVLYNRELPGVPSVVTDPVAGSHAIVDHLAALGHRELAYLAGPATSWADGRRWAALAERAAASGVALSRLGPFPPTVDGGGAAADAVLPGPVTALVAFNDLLAIGVLRRLERRGLRVPDDVSVVGYDDIFGADFCHPPLTTLASPAERAGRALADVLLTGRPAGEPRRTVLPTELVVRESTGPPRG